jgi:beta-glucanase (GH16 family)
LLLNSDGALGAYQFFPYNRRMQRWYRKLVSPTRGRLISFTVLSSVLWVGAAVALVGGHNKSENPVRHPHIDTKPKPKQANNASPPPKEPPKPTGEFSAEASWQEDFTRLPNGPFTSPAWHHDTDPETPGYNDESQAYTNNDPKNIFIENGHLVIAARRTQYSYPNDPSGKTYQYTSARIDTRDSFTFEYGKVEARIKAPHGKGTWPAWWFMSANQIYTARLHPTDADWEEERFYMHDGELDAMEAYGSNPGAVEGTLYTFNKTYEQSTPVPDASDTFHTYAVEVTPAKITWTIDGRPYFTVQKPSDNPDDWPIGRGNRFYTILNLALGGSGGGTIDDASANAWRMEVEYIKYYAYQRS